MTAAGLHVASAGPLVTVQDGGRFGHLRYGIPASGPMDRSSHAFANAVLGNAIDATAIEVSRAGAVFECLDRSLTVAVVSPGFRVAVDDEPVGPSAVATMTPGSRVSITAGTGGSWAYLAVAGLIDAPLWLGHTATHSLSGFGAGGLVAGSEVVVRDPRADSLLDGPIAAFRHNTGVADSIRVVLGPQDHRFTPEAIARLSSHTFTLTEAFDRMGVRLDGPSLDLDAALSIPSEPIVRGSIQVAGDGVATVLLADHQTTGGYPKIATVSSADLDAFSQRRAGDSVRFEPITPMHAIELTRARDRQLRSFMSGELVADRELARRLVTTDLIGDVAVE